MIDKNKTVEIKIDRLPRCPKCGNEMAPLTTDKGRLYWKCTACGHYVM